MINFAQSTDISQTYGKKVRDLHEEIDATGAEAAVAQWLGVQWVPRTLEEDAKLADIGDRIEVRHTKYDAGKLQLKDKDLRLGSVLFLVTGHLPDYTIRGWLPAADALKVRKWMELVPGRGPGWWVLQDDLWEVWDD